MRLRRGIACAALGAFGALAVFACGSFGEAPTDTNAPSPPAPSQAEDADAGPGDSKAPPDDATTSPPCPNGALLCEDFENGLAAWSDVTSAFSTGPASGHGNVLSVKLDKGGDVGVLVERPISGSGGGVQMTFAFRAADPKYTTEPPDSNYAIAGIRASGIFVALYLSRGNNSGFATAQVTGSTTQEDFKPTPNAELAYGVWHTVEIRLSLGQAGAFEWYADGKKVGGNTLASSVVPLSVVLGAYRPNAGTPALSVELDDVIVLGN